MAHSQKTHPDSNLADQKSFNGGKIVCIRSGLGKSKKYSLGRQGVQLVASCHGRALDKCLSNKNVYDKGKCNNSIPMHKKT